MLNLSQPSSARISQKLFVKSDFLYYILCATRTEGLRIYKTFCVSKTQKSQISN
jgi:hypothetical protein